MRPRISRTIIEKVEPNGRVQQIKKEIFKVEQRTRRVQQIRYAESRLSLAAKAVIQEEYTRASFYLDVASKILVTDVLKERHRMIKETMMSNIIKSF